MKPLRQQIVVEVKDRELKELRSELRKQSREGKEAATGLSRAFDKAGAKIKVAMAAAFAAVTAAIYGAARATTAFQQGLARVATLGGEAERSIGAFRKGLLDLYKDGPQKLGDLNAALYQTISAGVDASKAMGVLRVAMKAATGDGSDVATAVDGITNALNGFGKDASEATSVADAFFVAVQDGKTTFAELASSIGDVAAPANDARVSLEEVLAATAAITKNGLSTSQAITQIAAVFTAAQRNAKGFAQIGVDIERSLGEDGLQATLFKVVEAAERAGVELVELFGRVEGADAALTLTGTQADSMAKSLDNMARRAGKTEAAYQKMRGTMENLASRVMNNLNAQFIEMGTKALPLVNAALLKSLDILERFDSPVDKLLGSLEDLDGVNPTIIAQLKVVSERQTVLQAREEAMEALEDMEITVGVKMDDSWQRMYGAFDDFVQFGGVSTKRGRSAAGDAWDFIQTGFIKVEEMKKLSEMTERQIDQFQRETEHQLIGMRKAMMEAFAGGRGEEGMKLKMDIEVKDKNLRDITNFRLLREQVALSDEAIKQYTEQLAKLDRQEAVYLATIGAIADEYREMGSVIQAVTEAAKGFALNPVPKEAGLASGSSTKPAEPLSPEAIARIEAAKGALESVQRAQALANAGTEEQARLLAEVYEAQDQLRQIKEAEVELGKTATAQAREEATARLEAARAALSQQSALREAIREAATKTEAATVTLLPKTDPQTLAAAVREEMERLRAALDNQVALIEATITPEVSSEAKAQAEEEIAGLQAETEAALRRVLDLLRKEAPEVAQLLGTAFQDALGGLSTSGEAERRLKSDVERLQRDLARLVEPLEIELAIPDLPEDRRRAVVEEVARLKEAALAQLRALYEAAAEDAAAFSSETREALKAAFEDLDVDPGEVRGVLAEIDAVIRPFEAERLNLKVNLALGEIDKAAFEEGMKAAAESAKTGLQAVFQKLPPSLKENEQLMQALAEAIENVENAGEGAGKSVQRIGEGMQDVASALRSLSRITDVFGDMNEGAKDLVGSLADVLDNVGRLQALRASDAFAAMGTVGQAASAAVPVIGIATAMIGAVQGFQSFFAARREAEKAEAEEQRQAMQDLRDALNENAARISDAVARMVEASVKGSDVTGQQANALREAYSLFTDQRGRAEGAARPNFPDAGAAFDQYEESFSGPYLADDAVLREVEAFLDRLNVGTEGGRDALAAYIESLQARFDAGDLGTTTETSFGFLEEMLENLLRTAEREASAATEAPSQQAQAFRNLLGTLEALGLEKLEGIDLTKIFDDAIREFGGDVGKAIDALMQGTFGDMEVGLQSLIDTLLETGAFGDNVAGAVESLRLFQQILGLEAPEAIDHFIRFLTERVDGVSGELAARLAALGEMDVDTDAGRAAFEQAVQELFRDLEAGGEGAARLLGNLTPEELRRIIEALFNLGTSAEAGAVDMDRFGDAADRAYKAFDVLTRFFEEDAPAAFERFAELFLEGETGLNDAGKTLLDEARRLASGGLTSDAERERMREIGRMFAEELLRDQNLFGLSDEDAERLASLLMTTSQAPPGEGSEYSLRRQFDRSITEVQANEVIAVLYGQHATQRSQLQAQQTMAETLGKIHAALASASTGRSAAGEASAAKGTAPALAYRPASDDLLRQALAADYHAAQVPLVRSVQTLAGGQQAQYETSTSVFRDERSWQHSREFTDARETQTEEGDKIEVHLTQHFHGLPDERHVRDVARAVREQVVEEVQQLRRRAY